LVRRFAFVALGVVKVTVVLVIDILQALGGGDALDRDALANVLGCDRPDLDQPLAIGIQQGLIGTGERGWVDDPASFIGDYTITDAGRQLADHILDQYAQMVAGPPGLSVAERFLWACAQTQPDPVRQELVNLAENPALEVVSDADERGRALALVTVAVRRWARAALNAQADTTVRAIAIDNLDLSSLKALGCVSKLMRDEYLTDLEPAYAEVVAAAADAADSAWNLRLLAGSPGEPAVEQPFDTVLAGEVAEYAANAVVAAAHAGLAQVREEAKQAVAAMPQRQPPPISSQ
jgi:hypothetical protein